MSVACPALVLYIRQCAPRPDRFSLFPPPPPSVNEPTSSPLLPYSHPHHPSNPLDPWDFRSRPPTIDSGVPLPHRYLFRRVSPLQTPPSSMPALDIYPRDDDQALPTLTMTINPENTQMAQDNAAGDSDSLSPGMVGAIVVVSLLVTISIVTAAVLHRSRCMNPRCKVCRVLRCERRKPQTGL
jgi:hypothetical protein